MRTRLVVHLAADVEDVVARHRLDPLDGRGDGQPVARPYGTGVRELLVAVHHPAVVETELRIRDDLARRLEGDREDEGRRGDHIGMAERLRRVRVGVRRIGVAHRLGELADLLPADLVRFGGRIDPPDEGLVERHWTRSLLMRLP